ncbi:MAG: universal stress protein [Thermoplasmata archaeon]|nr:MAG: universal stress protein [Thermoplasmata archaeon]
MDSILVAYDDSEEAKKALSHAKNIIDEDDELILGMVIPPLEDKAFARVAVDMKISEAKSILKEVVTELKEQGIKARSVIKKGDVAENLLDMGNEFNCKLIVIGYKGVSKIGRFSLGSVIDKISRLANRPILVIK